MLEARLQQGSLLKRIVDALKDLVNEANVECSASGLSLQAMDTAHVCLVTLELRADGFELYRCDRTRTLGISLANLAKILKCAGACVYLCGVVAVECVCACRLCAGREPQHITILLPPRTQPPPKQRQRRRHHAAVAGRRRHDHPDLRERARRPHLRL
jgi:hypothetical protein